MAKAEAKVIEKVMAKAEVKAKVKAKAEAYAKESWGILTLFELSISGYSPHENNVCNGLHKYLSHPGQLSQHQ